MYNDSLVRRGEILLDFSVLELWIGSKEVIRMSDGRRGRPFTYPDSLIRLLASTRLISEALTSSDEPVYAVLDSIGIKVHSSGDWMRRHFKVRRGYLKVRIAVNAKTREIVAFEVMQEYAHDGTMLEWLVKESSRMK